MRKILLVAIVVIGFLLRIYNLSHYPIGFTPDEASFGYDAYSLLKTGKDQWGHSFPLVLESFGDFKPPLYSYLLMPFISLGGLEKWVVRLPNALAGSFAVIAIYFFAKELVAFEQDKRNKKSEALYETVPFFSAFLLSISSWHIMMSRGAFEANLSTFFLPLGAYLFLRGLRENKYLVHAMIVFGLNLFSYHSARLVTPLLVIVLFGLYWNEIKTPKNVSKWKIVKKPLIIFSVFLALMVFTFTKGAGERVSDVSIWGGAMEAAAGPRLESMENGTSHTVAKILHNKYTVVAKRFTSNYSQYFSREFLFTEGPAEATYGMIPGRGVLYSVEVLLVVGIFVYLWENRFIYKQIKKRKISKSQRNMLFLLLCVLLSPIPAALATGPGYAGNRAVLVVPFLYILLSYGGTYLFRSIDIKGRKMRILLKATYVFASLYLLTGFVIEYLLNSPFTSADAMLYGREEMVMYLSQKDLSPLKDSVVIDKRLSEPQIHVAFFQKIDPRLYQQWSKDWIRYRDSDVNFVDQLDEYTMGEFLFTTNFLEKTETFGDEYVQIGKPQEFISDIEPDYVVKYPDGSDAIYIVIPKSSEFAYMDKK